MERRRLATDSAERLRTAIVCHRDCDGKALSWKFRSDRVDGKKLELDMTGMAIHRL